MRLVIDLGNTRTKWALRRAGQTLQAGAAATDTLRAPDGWQIAFTDLASPTEVVVGAVGAADAVSALSLWARNTWRHEPRQVVTVATACGVVNGYEMPQRLGIDRWAGLVAARARQAGALCVVDAGTACTVDVMSPEGKHQGGWIVPGIGLQLAALRAGTAGVRTEGATASHGWGRDTASCVANGILAGLRGLVELAITDASTRWGQASCIVTGGDGALLVSALGDRPSLVPDLVIEGLDLLATEREGLA